MLFALIIFIILLFVFGYLFGPSPTAGRNITNNRERANDLADKAAKFSRSGNYNEALRCLEEASKLDPENVKTIFLIGIISLNVDDIEQSKEILAHLKKIDLSAAEVLEESILEYMQNNKNRDQSNTDNNYKSDLGQYYAILEVEVGAPKDKIRQAYKEMVKVWHPDRFEHDPKLKSKAQNKMKMINEAYQRLI